MRQARLTFLALVGVLVALLVAPAGALAADSVTVTGTVVRDGAPVTGVEVVIAVLGTDTVVSTATDERGAFVVGIEAGLGAELRVFATGRTTRSDPDRNGCVRSETPIGELTAVIEELPPAPLTVELDTVLTSTVCGATATPRVTPPSTDAPGPSLPARGPGAGLLLLLGVLGLAAAGALTTAPRRRR